MFYPIFREALPFLRLFTWFSANDSSGVTPWWRLQRDEERQYLSKYWIKQHIFLLLSALGKKIESLSTQRFSATGEPRAATCSELFTYSTFLYASTFILLRIFSVVETIGSNSGRDHCPDMPNHQFQFPSVAKKRPLLKLSNRGREGGKERYLQIPSKTLKETTFSQD